MPSSNFSQSINDLLNALSARYGTLYSGSPSSSKELRHFTFSVLTKNGISQAIPKFSHVDLDDAVLSAYSDPNASIADVQAAVFQSTILASLERAIYHRNLTPTRALAHLTAQLAGHKSSTGPIGKFLSDINKLESL